MLAITDLSKSYGVGEGRVEVLRSVSLAIATGETVALLGESGSGKSTLLHLAAGLDTPDAGAVVVDGVDLAAGSDADRAAARREKIGLVFQQFNLIPSLDVAANIAFQARLAGRFDAGWVARLTERLGLQGLEARYPEQLSGGQQQRVAIGRALAGRPPLILADEPTGNLDAETGDRVLALALELVSDAGSALLMATHSDRVAAKLGRRLRLDAGALERRA